MSRWQADTPGQTTRGALWGGIASLVILSPAFFVTWLMSVTDKMCLRPGVDRIKRLVKNKRVLQVKRIAQ